MFFNDQASIDAEIAEMMREVANIQKHMRPIIWQVYRRFLVESASVEEREYANPAEQIEAALIHRNYISWKDIEVCLAYDLSVLRSEANYLEIDALHQCLLSLYPDSAPESVS